MFRLDEAPILLFGWEMSANISIEKYESVTFNMSPFGFGKMTITIDLGAFGSVSASGFIFGPFVWITQ